MISNGQTDLLELIQNASESSEGLVRMDAVRRLKQRSLQRLDALALSEFARKAEDPAWRTTAAQVLGYHRVAVHHPDMVEPLTSAAAAEQDPEARRALVYAVRETDGAAELVAHPIGEVAKEAVSGVPVTETAWRLLLDGYFRGGSADTERRVLRLAAQMPPIADWVVAYLFEAEFASAGNDPTEAAAALLMHVDQGAAFASLMDAQDAVNRTHQDIWPGLARRGRKKVLLDLFAEAVTTVGLKPCLAETIATKAQGSDDYLRTNGRPLRSLLRGLSGRDGEQLVIVVAHAFDEAQKTQKRRLADLMLMVSKELPETSETVGTILSDWKDAPPEMLLKVRQTRMGIR